MEWDDDGLDDEPGSPLLPPDDRLWRHPSEVAETNPTAVRGIAAGPSSPPRVVTVVALTSCISVLITLGVVAVVRPFRVDESAAGGTARDVSLVGEVDELAARVRPAIAQVRAVGAADGGGDSLGSGVLFHEDGLLMTAHHIVDGATSVWVLLDDGRKVGAQVVGTDPETDIAVLDLDGGAFPVAVLASAERDAEDVVGQPAMTIGAPSGEVVSGPIVRWTKVAAVGQEAAVEGRKLMDMMRTGAMRASGCDGGAVVDRQGRVIGIASFEVMSGDGISVGYATPIAVASAVASQLVATGRVMRGWLGIEGETRDGALVHRVKPDSPAAAAGLASGDVITAIDGEQVASMSALVARLRTHKPGDGVRLSVQREAATIEMPATLADKPSG